MPLRNPRAASRAKQAQEAQAQAQAGPARALQAPQQQAPQQQLPEDQAQAQAAPVDLAGSGDVPRKLLEAYFASVDHRFSDEPVMRAINQWVRAGYTGDDSEE